MKLLFYIQSMIAGGAQRVVATLSNHWADRGWEITIVSLADTATDFYSLDPRVVRLQLPAHGQASGGGVLANVGRIRALRRVLRERQPDVAVAMMETASVVLALAGRGLGSVLIGAERIHPPFSEIPRHWHVARNFGFGWLDAVVAQTGATAEWLRRHTRARDVRVIPNPIELPLDRHDPLVSPPDRDAGGRMLLGAGRLVPQKNFHALIDAFARVAADVPTWGLTIIGDGVERDSLLSRARQLGVAERVTLPGKVGNAGDWYRRADLYAMTSHYEGFPNTLLEALAHGVPAVSVDCEAGPADLIRHETDGLLVPPGDLDAFASALRRLMAQDALRAGLAARAGEALPRFAVARIAAAWQELFTELIARRGRR